MIRTLKEIMRLYFRILNYREARFTESMLDNIAEKITIDIDPERINAICLGLGLTKIPSLRIVNDRCYCAGCYISASNQINIYLREIMELCRKKVDPDLLVRVIGRILAHEHRHAFQYQNSKLFFITEGIVMHLFVRCSIFLWIFWLTSYLSSSAISKPYSVLIILVSFLFGIASMGAVESIMHSLLYKISWLERDARRYAKQSTDIWLQAVKIDINNLEKDDLTLPVQDIIPMDIISELEAIIGHP